MQPATPEPMRIGYMTGAVRIDDGLGEHDLRSTTWNGPAADWNGSLRLIDHAAQFILLVEKHTVFARLVQDGFHEAHSCLLTTGNGYPGTQFRATLRLLCEQMKVPLYVLADNDPAGYSLFFLIARGALRQHKSTEDKSAIPAARYLGLRADDWERLKLSESVRIDLTEFEVNELQQLKSTSWLIERSDWQSEFDQIRRNGFKVEMEPLCSLQESFLARSYLPVQLLSGRALAF